MSTILYLYLYIEREKLTRKTFLKQRTRNCYCSYFYSAKLPHCTKQAWSRKWKSFYGTIQGTGCLKNCWEFGGWAQTPSGMWEWPSMGPQPLKLPEGPQSSRAHDGTWLLNSRGAGTGQGGRSGSEPHLSHPMGSPWQRMETCIL